MDSLFHRGRHGDDIGIRFFVDLEFNTLTTIHTSDDLAILVSPRDVGDVAQANIGPRIAGDNEFADLLERGKLIECANQILRLPLTQLAAW